MKILTERITRGKQYKSSFFQMKSESCEPFPPPSLNKYNFIGSRTNIIHQYCCSTHHRIKL